MTPIERATLIRRRAALLALYRDAEGPEQVVEVTAELDEITRALRGEPPSPSRTRPPQRPRQESSYHEALREVL